MSSHRYHRTVAASALALSLSVAVAGCASSPPVQEPGESVEPLPITLNLTTGSLTTLPLYVARDMGFFEDAGLIPESLASNSGTSAAQLLNSGQIDFALIGIPSAINASNSGADLVVAAGAENEAPFALQCRKEVEATPGYPDGIPSLRGKSIGFTAVGSSTDTYTRVILATAGVHPDEVELVQLGSVPNYMAAIEADRVDCFMSYQPLQFLLGKDVTTIVDLQAGEGPELIQHAPLSTYVTSRKFATENPEVITRFQKAITATNAFLSDQANAATIAEAVSPNFPGVSVEDLTTLIEGVQGSFVNAEEISKDDFDNSVEAYNIAYDQELEASMEDLILPLQ